MFTNLRTDAHMIFKRERHDWFPKWVKCTSLPYLKDIFTDVRADVRVLGRTDVHGGLYGGCYGQLDGCVYKHPYGRQCGLNILESSVGTVDGRKVAPPQSMA